MSGALVALLAVGCGNESELEAGQESPGSSELTPESGVVVPLPTPEPDHDLPSPTTSDPSYGTASQVFGEPEPLPEPAAPGTVVVTHMPGGSLAYSYTPVGQEPQPYKGMLPHTELSVPIGTVIELRLRPHVFEAAVSSNADVLPLESTTEAADDDDLRTSRFLATGSGDAGVAAQGVRYPTCDRPGAPISCETLTLSVIVTP
ncbi:MAG: hypothetical protein ACRD0U_15835 [Acidimicrobiales bacterium]